ncbi:MAG: 50S ribosomal protein L22 [Candidatus Nanoarchaeia archaeon]
MEAKLNVQGLRISTKQSIEVCKAIRDQDLDKAKKILQDSIDLKKPIPFKTFNRDMGHKKGMAAGRFAVNTCTEMLNLLNSVEKNAENKGLTGNLFIAKAVANFGPTSWHFGRKRRRQMKSTHIELILKEKEKIEKKTEEKKEVKKETKK